MDELAAQQAKRGAYAIERDDKGKPQLPERPSSRAGQLAWLTTVFAYDPRHPVTGGRHLGARGGSGIVELDRQGAPTIEFDPASVIGNGQKLREALTWGPRLPTDLLPYGWNNGQAAEIAFVVSAVCRATGHRTLADEAEAIVLTLMHTAEVKEGLTTHGGSGERYEAIRGLAPRLDEHERPLRLCCLIDSQTGEFVVRVGDAADIARKRVGSLRRGWLDGAMTALGWQRVTVQGYGLIGREGRRQGPHAGCDVYRGHLRPTEDDDR
jgi:hypothetical protein